jgi:hypothetical protein
LASAKLCQIVAAESGRKGELNRRATDAYKLLQKADLFAGQTRDYSPRDDEGVQLPPERQVIQRKATDVLVEVASSLGELFDITATKDFGNSIAKADVVVDGAILIKGAPVPYLLFLEKQLTDLHTVIKAIPTHSSTRVWEWDDSADCFKADTVTTTKTQKIPRNHVKAEATDRHPAQVEVYYEDIVIGYWKTVLLTSAFPATRVREMADRVLRLRSAVQYAREEANATVVPDVKVGRAIFDFVTGD